MKEKKYKIIYFQPANRSPIQDFIAKQQKYVRAKIYRCLDLVEQYGSDTGMPFVKKIDSELFELRIRGSVEIRFLFAVRKDVAVMLHGFKKKTQKIPLKELQLAKTRLKKYSIYVIKQYA
ncbi:MAG: type II toxin-antitoxin system RelE/ParE family toxin [Candidatus Pacebacteria bacterium]|nr:type II toxin-antitoxin system RelE/ParE family toxin [Candidatus Paceibacterota bacterium]